MVQVPEEFARKYMRMAWAEAKAIERSERCLVEDGHGGYIRCPESNRCSNCEKYGRFDFDTFRPASLDAMYSESEFEPASEQTDLFDDTSEIMDMLVQRLTQIKPKYGAIFRELLNGNQRPLHIAQALGLCKSQTYGDVKEVRDLADKLYHELMDE